MAKSVRGIIVATVFAVTFCVPSLFAPGARAAAPPPLLRIDHASANAPAIDAYINGQKVATAPQFAAVTPYTMAPAGTGNLQVIAAGAGLGGPVFIAATIELRDGGPTRSWRLIA